jgi:hypothetical protein
VCVCVCVCVCVRVLKSLTQHRWSRTWGRQFSLLAATLRLPGKYAPPAPPPKPTVVRRLHGHRQSAHGPGQPCHLLGSLPLGPQQHQECRHLRRLSPRHQRLQRLAGLRLAQVPSLQQSLQHLPSHQQSGGALALIKTQMLPAGGSCWDKPQQLFQWGRRIPNLHRMRSNNKQQRGWQCQTVKKGVWGKCVRRRRNHCRPHLPQVCGGRCTVAAPTKHWHACSETGRPAACCPWHWASRPSARRALQAAFLHV